jgi:hypothetical protein
MAHLKIELMIQHPKSASMKVYPKAGPMSMTGNPKAGVILHRMIGLTISNHQAGLGMVCW